MTADTTMVSDTITIDSVIYKKGKDILKDTTIYVEIPKDVPVDTALILRDFFAKNVYKDTVYFDENLGYASVLDTLQKNNILNRKWSYKVNKVENTITIKIPVKPKTQLYYGINGSVDKVNLFNSVGAGLILKTKNDVIYQTTLGISNTGNGVTPYIGAGVYWKLKFRK
jgi:hypothetical protein